ncbi:MAG TPA: EAL domain-containing protein [Thermoanaerobaculia bacterium]|nr:EAL domain-containing protein [Thermoanaerobaculia bacterium]
MASRSAMRSRRRSGRLGEAALNEAQRIAKVGSWELDLSTGELLWSDEVYRIFEVGPGAEEPIADAFLARLHPDDRDAVLESHRQSLAERTIGEVSYRLLLPDGRIRWLRQRCEHSFDDAGRPLRSVGTVQDVTEQKQAEEAVRESERRLRRVESLARIGHFGWDVPRQSFWWSPGTWELHGLEPRDEPVTLELIQSLVHPEDWPLVDAAMQAVLAGGEPAEIEFRLRLPTGIVRFLEGRGEIQLARQGRPILVTGFLQDVTERRVSEEHQRLAAKVFEQSREGICVTDADRRIIAVNEAFTEITGYSQSDVLGEHPRILSSGHHDSDFYDAMWGQIDATGHWRGEVTDRRRDGSVFACWLSISRLTDSSGRVTNYIANFSDITLQKEAQARIQWLAHFDPLTSLPNRVLLTDRMNQAIRQVERAQQPLALMFLDLDHFKNVNDTLGHRSGDALLVELAQRLVAVVRDSDTVSRLGGDEFILLLPGADASAAATIAEHLLADIARPFRLKSYELTVTSSIGIALYPLDGADFETLMKCADTAMYRAKNQGRNAYRFFTAEMQELAARHLLLEAELRRALDRGQLYLHYQPQMALGCGHILGVEALLRWRHPELGQVPPTEFIPIAEDTGLILAIGEWVLRTAVRQVKTWHDEGLPPLTVAVNLSAVQFLQPNLPELVRRALMDAELPAEHLELELTETVATRDPPAAMIMMAELRGLGVRLALDDFGTGHASLAYLKRFRVNKLKIEGTFVRDLDQDPEDKAIVQAILGLARSLNFRCSAEGVETAEQLEYLRQQGCDEVQGYYISRPVPAEEVPALVKQHGERVA